MKIKDLVLIGVFAAVTAVMSQISIPLPFGVPLTLQTFAVALCGYFLGSKKSVLSVLVYILLGAVGAPVFSGFKGGFSVLLSVTGGFIVGFVPLTLLCGINTKKIPVRLVLGAAGIISCHIFGILQYALIMGINPIESFLTVSAPFLIKDFISVATAMFAAIAISKAVARANLKT